MLSKLRSKKSQLEAYDVKVSLISCTNLKISGEEVLTNNGIDDVKLYASFITNNEGIPLTMKGVAGNTQITSKPLMRTHAVDTTALWGDDQRACTAAEFSHNVPNKKSTSNEVLILLGLMKGEESFPLAMTNLDIDPSREDQILTLPVKDIPAEQPTHKKRFKLFSLSKRKTKEEPKQPDHPVLLDRFRLQSSAHGAKLNVRVQVQVKGKEQSNVINNTVLVEEDRHDVEKPLVLLGTEETCEDSREEFCEVEQVEDDLHSDKGVVADEGIVADEFTIKASSFEQASSESMLENVLQGFSCGSILTCEGKEEAKSEVKPTQESNKKISRNTVDKNVESVLKEVVDNVRNELELGLGLGHSVTHQSKHAYEFHEHDSEDASYTVGTETVGTYTVGDYTVGTKTVDIDAYVGLGTVKEDTVEEDTAHQDAIESRKSRAPANPKVETKQEQYYDENSCDDTFTAFDNLSAYTEDVTTAFGTRANDESTFMGGNVFM
eukprot:scaffold22001_cov151-Skeletonema_dohrnii-CCMP3373.AAC.4